MIRSPKYKTDRKAFLSVLYSAGTVRTRMYYLNFRPSLKALPTLPPTAR